MTIDIHPARAHEVAAVAALQVELFREDAGVHDPSSDQSWPVEHGVTDITDLIERDAATVLVATAGGTPIGFVAGYVVASSPTRLTSSHAVLRSLYVARDHRRSGAGAALVSAFVDWAKAAGGEEVVVDHYADNGPAGDLYARFGFEARSITRILTIDRG